MQSTTAPNTSFTTQTNQLLLRESVNSSSNADLVLGALRHQRDLFSGPLGIPDVTTRVGSVIHAFETMARQRQALERSGSGGEKPYDSTVGPRFRSHRANVKRVNDNRHKIILPSPKISPSSSAATDTVPTFVQQSYPNPNPSFLSSIINGSVKHNNSTNSNNLHINNNNLGQYFLHSNNHNNHNQTIPRTTFQSSAGPEIHYNLANDNESSNFDSLNLDDDYRKSSFGKQSKLQPSGAGAAPAGGGTLSRNQHLNDATSSAQATTNFHATRDTEGTVISHSRNNPNVFFNATPPPPPRGSVATPSLQQVPEKDTPASPQTPTTMRYYNNHLENDGDNNNNPNYNPGNDKFLRGSTVSQSFIKNVKNMRRKSSSYDLQSASGAAGLGTGRGGTTNSSPPTTTSSSSNGFKQRTGALMTTAARHLYRRKAKGPGSDNDTDELTTPRPQDSAHVVEGVDGRRTSSSFTNTTTGRRKTFQPRTLDRAEI